METIASNGSSSQCCGIGQRVAVGDVELLVVDVVQEHVDPAQVVGREVDLLAEEPQPHVVAAEHLRELQQQRPRAAGRVVDLVHLGLADDRDPGEQFRHLLRREEFAAGLAGVRGVHRHQVLVSVAERVDRVVGVPEVEVADRVEQLDELLVALRHRRPELARVDVEVVEQALEVVLARGADRGALDVAEDLREGLVEVLVVTRPLPYVCEELAGEDVEALLGDRLPPPALGLDVTEGRIVEVGASRLALLLVQVRGQVLRDEAVEERPEDVGLEVPAVDAAAQIVGDPPDRLVQLRPLRLLAHRGHVAVSQRGPTSRTLGRLPPVCAGRVGPPHEALHGRHQQDQPAGRFVTPCRRLGRLDRARGAASIGAPRLVRLAV